MKPYARQEVVQALRRYDRLLEVGIGRRPGVARRLAAAGSDVVALDVDPDAGTDLPESVTFLEGDIVEFAETTSGDDDVPPELDAIDAVYALHLPAELQRPTVRLADALDAHCVFTTLGFERPIVPVEPQPLSETTLYSASDRPGSSESDR